MNHLSLSKISGRQIISCVVWMLGIGTIQSGIWADENAVAIARRNLPAGAELVSAVETSNGKSIQAPAVDAIFTGGVEEVAFIFRYSEHLSIGFVQANGLISEPLPGNYPQVIEGIAGSVAFKSLVPGLPPMLLAATSDSASIGSYLSVYSTRNGVLQNAAGSPVDGFSLEVNCAHTEMPCRILGWGKWTDIRSSTLDVYEWNGTSYIHDNVDLRTYTEQRLSQMTAKATDTAPATVVARVGLTQLIMQKYHSLQDDDLAMQMADAVLQRLDDPKSVLTRGNGGQPVWEIAQGKVLIHEWKSNIYKENGKTAEADAETKLAVSERATQ